MRILFNIAYLLDKKLHIEKKYCLIDKVNKEVTLEKGLLFTTSLDIVTLGAVPVLVGKLYSKIKKFSFCDYSN